MKKNKISRRDFLKHAAVGAAGITTLGVISSCTDKSKGNLNELFIPGTYTSTQDTGFATVVITCEFSTTALKDVSYEVTKSSDSDYFRNFVDAAKDYCQRIVKANGTANVDGISGASLSSDAIKEGVNDCTAQALGITTTKTELDPQAAAEAKAASILPEELEMSSLEMDTITDFHEKAEYDIVVIGAGASGIPAALAAAEAGSRVCILQKHDMPVSQGKLAGFINSKDTDDLGLMQWTQEQMATYNFNNDFNLMKTYAYASQGAIGWLKGHLDSAGYTSALPHEEPDHVYEDSRCKINGLMFTKSFGDAAKELETYCTKKGVQFYLGTPAVQLLREDKKVTGVIGKSAKGYIRITAKKGVILAAGDYQNNDAMVRHYLPDADLYKRKQSHKTGDGHLLGMTAGAQIEPTPHCKMIHADGSSVMREEPLLAVNMEGDRFYFNNVSFASRNTILRYQPQHQMVSIFDANYEKYVSGWGGQTTGIANASPEQLAKLVKEGVVLKADTLEDLAAQAGVPAKNLLASVKRHNALCRTGRDVDFGTPARYMKPVDTAPFYAQVRAYRISAIPSGLITDSNCQCLDSNRVPIPGLFAAGNCAGAFFGGVDYSLNTSGISLGRAITFGYIAGKHVSTL